MILSQSEYIKSAKKAMSDPTLEIEQIVISLHSAIECGASGTSRGSSLAYTMLGQVAGSMSSGLDGGYSGVGFFALALLHDPENVEARESLLYALVDDSPEKFIDDPLLRKRLQ